MKNSLVLFCSILVLGITAVKAQQVTKNTFGKGLRIMAEDSSFSMKFSTRIQSLFVGETVLDGNLSDNEVATQFQVRRARLKFDGFAYSPKLEYKIELGVSNRDLGDPSIYTKNGSRVILDAVVKWNFYKNFELWAGQTKLPGNRERVISSQALQFVDRSKLNSLYNLDRDMGIQLRNSHKWGEVVIKEAFAFSQGEGRNITAPNMGGYDYTSRIEVLPFGNFASSGDYFGSDLKREQKPKLAIGATYDYHDNAVRQNGNMKSYMDESRTLKTWFVDMMFKYKGFSVMAEYADKVSTKNAMLYDSENHSIKAFTVGQGINVQAGYLFAKNWELAARYTKITPYKITEKNNIDEYTFGFSRYVKDHNLKFQSDVTITQEATKDPVLMMRAQVELAF